jgi:hypothetical protein
VGGAWQDAQAVPKGAPYEQGEKRAWWTLLLLVWRCYIRHPFPNGAALPRMRLLNAQLSSDKRILNYIVTTLLSQAFRLLGLQDKLRRAMRRIATEHSDVLSFFDIDECCTSRNCCRSVLLLCLWRID